MYRPNGYLDDPRYGYSISDAVAMATKEIHYHSNDGLPYITVKSMPEPAPKDVHFYHYYRKDGSLGSPRNNSSVWGFPKSYVVIGTVEYGRVTSIDPTRSTPGVGGLPSRILAEIQAVYATVPHAVVIIMNNSGQFTIQAQLVSQQQESQMHFNGQYNYLPTNPYHYLPPPPQVVHVGPGGHTIRPSAPGQPIIIYPSPPRPRRREETIIVDPYSSDSDEDDSPRVGRTRRIDDRSELKKRHDELYRDEDGIYRRRRKERNESPDRVRGRGDSTSRSKNGGDKNSPRGVYRTGNKDERRIRNSMQDNVLGDHSRRHQTKDSQEKK